ncbi:unnamed protein product, partial [Cyprideis torosa]
SSCLSPIAQISLLWSEQNRQNENSNRTSLPSRPERREERNENRTKRNELVDTSAPPLSRDEVELNEISVNLPETEENLNSIPILSRDILYFDNNDSSALPHTRHTGSPQPPTVINPFPFPKEGHFLITDSQGKRINRAELDPTTFSVTTWVKAGLTVSDRIQRIKKGAPKVHKPTGSQELSAWALHHGVHIIRCNSLQRSDFGRDGVHLNESGLKKICLRLKQKLGLPRVVSARIPFRSFQMIKTIIEGRMSGEADSKLDPVDKILLTIMKLRHDFGFMDLGIRFGISDRMASSIFSSVLLHLHNFVFNNLIRDRIPSLKKCKQSRPPCLENYSNVRFIVDCTEFPCHAPYLLKQKRSIYSHYKSRYTFKALVAIAPNGTVTFVSELYGGSVSDKVIVMKSGFLDLLESGECILADKGFLIGDLLPPGVNLNLPPFLTRKEGHRRKFTNTQARDTTAIARARIHVERVMARIKIFKILSNFKHSDRSYANEQNNNLRLKQKLGLPRGVSASHRLNSPRHRPPSHHVQAAVQHWPPLQPRSFAKAVGSSRPPQLPSGHFNPVAMQQLAPPPLVNVPPPLVNVPPPFMPKNVQGLAHPFHPPTQGLWELAFQLVPLIKSML